VAVVVCIAGLVLTAYTVHVALAAQRVMLFFLFSVRFAAVRGPMALWCVCSACCNEPVFAFRAPPSTVALGALLLVLRAGLSGRLGVPHRAEGCEKERRRLPRRAHRCLLCLRAVSLQRRATGAAGCPLGAVAQGVRGGRWGWLPQQAAISSEGARGGTVKHVIARRVSTPAAARCADPLPPDMQLWWVRLPTARPRACVLSCCMAAGTPRPVKRKLLRTGRPVEGGPGGGGGQRPGLVSAPPH
jgi:hypothetical protein